MGLAVVGAQVLFRFAYYDGEWLPNTFYAKTSGYGDRAAYVMGGLAPLLGIWGLAVAVVGWFIEPRSARACLVAGGVGLAGSLLPLIMGADWMMGYRYIVPYLPVLAAVVCVGWSRLGMRAFRALPVLAVITLLATVPASYLLQRHARESLLQLASLRSAGTLSGHAALAEWLRKDARPGDSVVLMDIGLVGYRCIEQTVIDLTGLTDRYIAKSPGTFLAKQFDPAYIFDQRPRYIVFAFRAPGDPYAPLAEDASLIPFSEMEARLLAHPDFRRFYVDSTRSPGQEQGTFG